MVSLMAILGVAMGLLLVMALTSRSPRRRSTSDGGDGTMHSLFHGSSGAEFGDSIGCSDGSSGGDGGGCGDGGGGGGGD
jgi:hypothetical protein